MHKFAIIADTSQGLSFEDARENDFYLLSYYLKMGDTTYTDLVDIDNTYFYEHMGDFDELKTSIPSPDDVEQAITKIKAEGYTDILCCTSAPEVTGMYNLLNLIKQHHPELNMYIVDTKQIAMGTGLQTMRAVHLRNQGWSAQEVYDYLRTRTKNGMSRALFRTLKYVIKGGRLTPFKGTIGMLLRINPLLEMIDGNVTIIEPIRGKRKSLNRLIEITKRDLDVDRPYYLSVYHGNNPEELKILFEELKEEIQRAQFFMTTGMTPVLGVHSGPRAVAISYFFTD